MIVGEELLFLTLDRIYSFTEWFSCGLLGRKASQHDVVLLFPIDNNLTKSAGKVKGEIANCECAIT